jgi:hypothetical protein
MKGSRAGAHGECFRRSHRCHKSLFEELDLRSGRDPVRAQGIDDFGDFSVAD